MLRNSIHKNAFIVKKKFSLHLFSALELNQCFQAYDFLYHHVFQRHLRKLRLILLPVAVAPWELPWESLDVCRTLLCSAAYLWISLFPHMCKQKRLSQASKGASGLEVLWDSQDGSLVACPCENAFKSLPAQGRQPSMYTVSEATRGANVERELLLSNG